MELEYELNIEYRIQGDLNRLAEIFIIGEDFIGDDNVKMILGDNIVYGKKFSSNLKEATNLEKGQVVFGYYVQDPRAFGIVSFDENGKVISLEEKTKKLKSKYAVTGLYFYNNSVVEKSKSLKPSER